MASSEEFLEAGLRLLGEMPSGHFSVPLRAVCDSAQVPYQTAYSIFGGEANFNDALVEYALKSCRVDTAGRLFSTLLGHVERGARFEETVNVLVAETIDCLSEDDRSFDIFMASFAGPVTAGQRHLLRSCIAPLRRRVVELHRVILRLHGRCYAPGVQPEDLFTLLDGLCRGFALMRRVGCDLDEVDIDGEGWPLGSAAAKAIVESYTVVGCGLEPYGPEEHPFSWSVPEDRVVDPAAIRRDSLKSRVALLEAGLELVRQPRAIDGEFGPIGRLRLSDVAAKAGYPGSAIRRFWSTRQEYLHELAQIVLDRSADPGARTPRFKPDQTFTEAARRYSLRDFWAYRSRSNMPRLCLSLALSADSEIRSSVGEVIDRRIKANAGFIAAVADKHGMTIVENATAEQVARSLLALADGVRVHAGLATNVSAIENLYADAAAAIITTNFVPPS